MLAVTRAFLLHPAILLLDEPTTGIDAIGRAQVAEVLREICRGLTVLLVDHDVAFISQFADWICCLEQGKFVEEGPSGELVCRPGLFRDLLEVSMQEHAQEVKRLQTCLLHLDDGIKTPHSRESHPPKRQ